MSWILHRWVWKLRGPVSVGMAPAGALSRCRLYVPARAVWGACTAELAQKQSSDFGKVGRDLREQARFGYLFPAEHDGGSWRAWLPRFERDQGLLWVREDDPDGRRSRSDREFRLSLLEARAGTAVAPETDSADDGSLRETECIATRWRANGTDTGGEVALVGYVFLRDGVDLDDVTTLFLGGDARYGLGRVELVSRDGANNMFGTPVRLEGDDPGVESRRVLGHAAASCGMLGALERVVGWDRYDAGLHATGEPPLWVPGSTRDNDKAAATWWIVKSDGIWLDESRAPGTHGGSG
jgi:hypothetical protein